MKTTAKRTRTVIANRRRFITFLVGVLLLTNLIVFGFLLPNTTQADLDVPAKTVTVCKGDTLWTIAQQHYENQGDIRNYVYRIREANGLPSSRLTVGQTLVLPAD